MVQLIGCSVAVRMRFGNACRIVTGTIIAMPSETADATARIRFTPGDEEEEAAVLVLEASWLEKMSSGNQFDCVYFLDLVDT